MQKIFIIIGIFTGIGLTTMPLSSEVRARSEIELNTFENFTTLGKKVYLPGSVCAVEPASINDKNKIPNFASLCVNSGKGWLRIGNKTPIYNNGGN